MNRIPRDKVHVIKMVDEFKTCVYCWFLRANSEELEHPDEAGPSSLATDCLLRFTDSNANRKCATPPVVAATAIVAAESAGCNEEVPLKRLKQDSSMASSSDTVAKALMRSAEALQRLAERKSIFDRATAGPRDADECFADFVCMSLKSIDNESRVHARIAILHALAQFQT